MSQDSSYIWKILGKTFGFTTSGIRIQSMPQNAPLVVYGAGANCGAALSICEVVFKKQISCICDRDTEKQKKGGYRGYKIISPERLLEEYDHKTTYVLISSTKYKEEISQWLAGYFEAGHILCLSDEAEITGSGPQYFDQEIIKLEDGEIFVDGGAYDFDSSKALLSRCRAEKIYAFEPDEINLEKIKNIVGQYKDVKISLFQNGLWDKNEILRFESNGTIGSHISENGDVTIHAAALDEIIKERVTYIKMDIEGAELKALTGAAGLIQKYKPKLAICVYHKPEDIIEIPAYILSLVPEYKLYLRHYAWNAAETVLYAVLPE